LPARFEIRSEHERGELVAAEPAQHVALAQRLLHGPGRLHEQPVAGGVAEALVDRAEVVEVDGDQGGGPVCRRHRRQAVDLGAKRGARQQAGERVVRGVVPGPVEQLGGLARDPPGGKQKRHRRGGEPDRLGDHRALGDDRGEQRSDHDHAGNHADPVAAGTGSEVTAGSTASSPPRTTASRIRTRAA
jgi:hypothetical protein